MQRLCATLEALALTPLPAAPPPLPTDIAALGPPLDRLLPAHGLGGRDALALLAGASVRAGKHTLALYIDDELAADALRELAPHLDAHEVATRPVGAWVLARGVALPPGADLLWHAAASRPDSPLWHMLAANEAVRRAGRTDRMHLPLRLPADARAAHADLLRDRDVYALRLHDTELNPYTADPAARVWVEARLAAGSDRPETGELCLCLVRDAAEPALSVGAGAEAALRLHAGVDSVSVALADEPMGTPLQAWTLRAGPGGVAIERIEPHPQPPRCIVVHFYDAGRPPRIHAEPSLLGGGLCVRVYTMNDAWAELPVGQIGVAHPLMEDTFARAVAAPVAAPHLDEEGGFVVPRTMALWPGAEAASPRRELVVQLVAEFVLDAATMRFVPETCGMAAGVEHGPLALFLYENEQWLRDDAPLLVAPAEKALPAVPTARAEAPPASAGAQRFGHTAHRGAGRSTPATMHKLSAYVAPDALYGRVKNKLPGWMGLYMSELHPDAERTQRDGEAQLLVMDPQRHLAHARIDVVAVRLHLHWRRSAGAPLHQQAPFELRFHLLHGPKETRALGGAPADKAAPRAAQAWTWHWGP